MTAFALALRTRSGEGPAAGLANSLRARVRETAVSASRGSGTSEEPRRGARADAAQRAAPRRAPAGRAAQSASDRRPGGCLDRPPMAAFPAAEDCLQQALAHPASELLEIAIRAQETAADWPQATAAERSPRCSATWRATLRRREPWRSSRIAPGGRPDAEPSGARRRARERCSHRERSTGARRRRRPRARSGTRCGEPAGRTGAGAGERARTTWPTPCSHRRSAPTAAIAALDGGR